MKIFWVSVAYLPMRVLAILAVVLFIDPVWSQVDVPSSQTAKLPMYRPILLGTGPEALINRIDTADLIRKGQKDAAIMFSCSVKKDGAVISVSTYRGTPDSKLLEQEVMKKLSAAANPKFIPAIYNHLPVDAIYYGAVLFRVVDGKPRLRIFSNQEPDELKKESDFVSPQPFWGADSKFNGFGYPSSGDAPVQVDGSAELQLKVNAAGDLVELTLLSEEPPFLGFGDTAFEDMSKAKFIPAFRDGKPVACDVKIPVYFNARGF
ncbi:MAG TPA: energy transducer TonB [Chthoniobacterales bacterium]|nr:energy transducer TonB [Chthoniobacterales bacterium]